MSKYDEKSPKDCPLVTIEWEDITHFSAWNEQEDDIGTTSIVTAGWLLDEDDKQIVIAGSYDYDSEQWADYHAFPKIPATVNVLYVPGQE